MSSEYTTHFTHSIQFVCILYNLYCIVHIDYTDSQIYFDIILYSTIYIQNVCKNECAVCAMYIVHCKYTVYILHIYAHCAIGLLFNLKLCIYPRRSNAFCAHW